MSNFSKIQSTKKKTKKQNPLSYYILYNEYLNTISLRALVVVVVVVGKANQEKDAKVSQGCWANLSHLVSREGERNPPLVSESGRFQEVYAFAYPSPLPPH